MIDKHHYGHPADDLPEKPSGPCMFCGAVMELDFDDPPTPDTRDCPGDPGGYMSRCPHCDATLDLEEKNGIQDKAEGYYWHAGPTATQKLTDRLIAVLDHCGQLGSLLSEIHAHVIDAEATQKREAKSERLAEQCRRAV